MVLGKGLPFHTKFSQVLGEAMSRPKDKERRGAREVLSE